MEQMLQGAGRFCEILANIFTKELENSEYFEEAAEIVGFLPKLKASCK